MAKVEITGVIISHVLDDGSSFYTKIEMCDGGSIGPYVRIGDDASDCMEFTLSRGR